MDGRESGFDAINVEVEFSFEPQALFFDFQGKMEMDDFTGKGSMELIGKNKAEIVLDFANGDVLT